MQFCFQYPARAMNRWDEWLGDNQVGELAQAAEHAGFGLVSASDHPFPDAQWVQHGGHHALDPFVILAFMAAATKRLQALTCAVVSGYRHPYVTAKAASSLDQLSRGRLVLGMVAGYQEAEFDVLGAPFADRGPRLDAAVAAMRASWSGEVVTHDDRFFSAQGHISLPRPWNTELPIWFGGNGRPSRRRVATIGDGWLPIEQTAEMERVTGTPSLSSDEALARSISAIQQARVDAGREPDFATCFAPLARGTSEDHVARVATLLPGLRDAGVTHVLIESRARSFAECVAEMPLYRDLIAS